MTITVDLASEHYRTGTTSPQTFSHTGASSGVKGVIVKLVHGTSTTDHVSAVSYGGVALTRAVRVTTATAEPGAAEIWFLGSSVPQGTQTVSYTPGSTTEDIHCVAVTLLGDSDLEIIDSDSTSGTFANPSLTLQNTAKTGTSAMAFAALYSGTGAPTNITAGTNCTIVHDNDLGAFVSSTLRQTTAQTGTGDFTISATVLSDDVAFCAVSVAETSTGSVTLLPSLFTGTNSYYTHVVTRGAVALTQSATYSGTNSFYTHTLVRGTRVLSPSLYSNSPSYFGHTLAKGAVTLAPSALFSNTGAFYTHTVVRGSVTLTASLYQGTPAYYTHTVSQAGVSLQPSRYNNTQVFYGPTLVLGSVGLVPSLYTNGNSIFSATIVRGTVTLAPSLVTSTPAYFTHAISTSGATILYAPFFSNAGSGGYDGSIKYDLATGRLAKIINNKIILTF